MTDPIAPAFVLPGIVVWHGDCIDVMRQLPDNSIDAIVTDPPYGLGFMGKAWDDLPPGLPWAVECLRVLKPGGHLLAFGGTRTWHRLAAAVEDAGFEIRDSIAWLYGSGFPKSLDVAKVIDKLDAVDARLARARRCQEWLRQHVTAQQVDAATGTRMGHHYTTHPTQPSVPTLAHLDALRVPSTDSQLAEKYASVQNAGARANSVYGADVRDRAGAAPHEGGRWPANVALDDTQATALDQQTGITRDGVAVNRNRTDDDRTSWYGTRKSQTGADVGYGGEGGASRFFPTFRYQAKAPTRERPKVDGVAHPTVKPLELMRWLVRLVTPPGGIVLDPFAGSGTTLEAARLEGFSAFGVERSDEYLPLIRHRLDP